MAIAVDDEQDTKGNKGIERIFPAKNTASVKAICSSPGWLALIINLYLLFRLMAGSAIWIALRWSFSVLILKERMSASIDAHMILAYKLVEPPQKGRHLSRTGSAPATMPSRSTAALLRRVTENASSTQGR
jgi:hypothetical protein